MPDVLSSTVAVCVCVVCRGIYVQTVICVCHIYVVVMSGLAQSPCICMASLCTLAVLTSKSVVLYPSCLCLFNICVQS
jgi:hypothetical protein